MIKSYAETLNFVRAKPSVRKMSNPAIMIAVMEI